MLKPGWNARWRGVVRWRRWWWVVDLNASSHEEAELRIEETIDRLAHTHMDDCPDYGRPGAWWQAMRM